MFLLYPPLLHRSSMPMDVKAAFRELKIPKPEQIFMRLPSTAAVFQDLRLYQNSALAQFLARGLTAPEDIQQGLLAIRFEDLPNALRARAGDRNEEDNGLTEFLIGPYSTLPLRGINSIYRKAGLPSRAIAS